MTIFYQDTSGCCVESGVYGRLEQKQGGRFIDGIIKSRDEKGPYGIGYLC